MKKIIFVLILMGLCVFAFAQNDKAKTFIAKAKQCEAQKKYASALGHYYDAVVADPEESEDAYDAFQKLSGQIMSGQPGFGNYNEFTLYDNWVLLLKDAEAYWTTNSPYVFKFSELKKKNVNYEKRTADYSLSVGTVYSEKYKEIVLNAIFEGLKKSYTDSWGNLQYWPQSSAYTEKDGTPTQIYKKYGAAIVRYVHEPDKDLRWKYAEAKLLETLDADGRKEWNSYSLKKQQSFLIPKILDIYSGFWLKDCECYLKCGYSGCASLSTPLMYDKYDDIFVKETLFNDVKLTVVDKSGNILAKSTRFSAPTPTPMFRYDVGTEYDREGFYYRGPYDVDCNFYNLPASVMEKIDNNEYEVVVSEAWINYGDFHPSLEDWYTRKSVSSLPDIPLDVKQFEKADVGLTDILKNKEEKAALEVSVKQKFYAFLENTKKDILFEICNKIKVKKNVTIEELVLESEGVWLEKYNSSKEQYDKEKYYYNNGYDIPYPEFDNEFASQIIEKDAKDKLFIIDKKGSVVLTKEGMQLLKKK